MKAYKGRAVLYPDPSYASKDFLDFITRIGTNYRWIIPSMEKTQLQVSRIASRLEERGVLIPIPPNDILASATSKIRILGLANENLIPTPPTVVLDEAPSISDIEGKLGFPFIMKVSREVDVDPGPRERYFVARRTVSQEEIKHAFSRLVRHGPVIFQSYMSGIGLGVSYIFNRYGQLISYFGHRRILEAYRDGGPSLIAETYLHPEAFRHGLRLLKSLGWRGPAMVEFKMTQDGRLYFMELNPRFWGTLPLATVSGVDFPRLLLRNYENKSASPTGPVRTKVLVRTQTLYLLMDSLRKRNAYQVKRITTSIPRVFNRGIPALADAQEVGLGSLVREALSLWEFGANKNDVTRIGPVAFGPALSGQRLRRLGVQHVIDLREDREKPRTNPDGSDLDGIKVHCVPLLDDRAPDVDAFQSIVLLMDDLLRSGSVYVHCRLGRGRAPTIVLGWLLHHGFDLDTSFALLYSRRPYSNLNLLQKESVYRLYRHYNVS
ncbi:MAG: ATP-grasp domain-containing protein [Thaumarchaeota archaeon]|nr:ATP-grasp domain-containing protein [Nitrososphaerota archaeon]